MRTTVDIDTHLLRRLRAEAHRCGLSFKELLNRVLQRGLDEPASVRATPYQCPTFSMGAQLRPLDRALALAEVLEDEEITRELALRK